MAAIGQMDETTWPEDMTAEEIYSHTESGDVRMGQRRVCVAFSFFFLGESMGHSQKAEGDF